jgi:hypothetical protein
MRNYIIAFFISLFVVTAVQAQTTTVYTGDDYKLAYFAIANSGYSSWTDSATSKYSDAIDIVDYLALDTGDNPFTVGINSLYLGDTVQYVIQGRMVLGATQSWVNLDTLAMYTVYDTITTTDLGGIKPMQIRIQALPSAANNNKNSYFGVWLFLDTRKSLKVE